MVFSFDLPFKALEAPGTFVNTSSEEANSRENAEEDYLPITVGAEAEDRGPKKLAREGSVALPWAEASSQIRSPSLRLCLEVVELCRLLKPSPEEVASREESITRTTALINDIFPSAVVNVFGSYSTGVYLPTSETELVILNSGCQDGEEFLKEKLLKGVRDIGDTLFERGTAQNIQVIGKLEPPHLKFDDIKSGVSFDISFDPKNLPDAAWFVWELLDELPPLGYLLTILELFLQQRGLNVVHQAGIGSYALMVMVASFLLMHDSRRLALGKPAPNLTSNLGLLLIDFFRLYGRTLNTDVVGISCLNGGRYFKRVEQFGPAPHDRKSLLAIEDPRDSTNDLGRNSFAYPKVQKAFDFAYKLLTGPSLPEDSLLARLVRLDAILLSRVPELQGSVNASESDMEIDSEDEKPPVAHHSKPRKRSAHTVHKSGRVEKKNGRKGKSKSAK